MKYSVKRKIAVTFIVVMTAALAAIALLNYAFLGTYYTYQKVDTLKQAWSTLDQLNVQKSDDVPSEFTQFCATNNLKVLVVNAYLNGRIYQNTIDSEVMQIRLAGIELGLEQRNTEVLEKVEQEDYNFEIQNFHETTMNIDYLQLVGELSNNNYCMIQCPIDSIEDAAAISNQFYTYVGIVTILVGAVVIWLVASRIVRPIKELTEISKRMAALDFDARYVSGGEDEIGELGNNFNSMSDKLELAISELKSANAELQKDIEKKTQIDEMRREFLSNVTHELKTPLALIQGYAEGLKDNINEDQESRDFYCDVIVDEASKMNEMVKKLLNLNQLEFGNDQMTMERFDLAEVIRGVLQSSGILIEQKGAKVVFNQQDPVPVWGDEFKVEEVITNYLTNALNHLDYDHIIEISCKAEGNVVTTTVFNTGDPIPEEDIDKIWIKFYKVDKARTREYGGSGIGLSIVKAIMDSLNQKCGAVNYENGVAFWFTLEKGSLERDSSSD